MKRRPFLIVAALGLVMLPQQIVSANPQLAVIEGSRANMDLKSPERFRSARFDYDHELTIALPASYHAQPTRTYPVLWVLDGPLMTRTVVGILDALVIGNEAPEMIVIGVGSPAADGLAGVGRRIAEFSPPGNGYAPSGFAGQVWSSVAPIPPFQHRADDFLAMLTDELRPQLARRYRFSGEHALYGHSAGGMFAAYAMLRRPDAFGKVILGSPYLAGVDDAVSKEEARYSLTHRDLPVEVFVGTGDQEMSEWFLAASGIVSSTAKLVETLQLRRYPSLRLTARIYSGENHYTTPPRVISDGIRTLWRNDTAKLKSSWPTPDDLPTESK